jgi:hypothetical protein
MTVLVRMHRTRLRRVRRIQPLPHLTRRRHMTVLVGMGLRGRCRLVWRRWLLRHLLGRLRFVWRRLGWLVRGLLGCVLRLVRVVRHRLLRRRVVRTWLVRIVRYRLLRCGVVRARLVRVVRDRVLGCWWVVRARLVGRVRLRAEGVVRSRRRRRQMGRCRRLDADRVTGCRR